MTLRVKDQLTTPGLCHLLHASSDGSRIIQDRDFAITNTRIIGSHKSIDSVYTGKFVPGIFRVNPVTIKSGEASCTSGKLEFNSKSNPCGARMVVTGPYMGSRGQLLYAASDGNLNMQALANAYAKTKDADFNLFVALGEIKETIELLRNPISSLLRAFSKAPGPYPGAHRLADAMGGSWLTWWYGIYPIYKDICDAIKLIQNPNKSKGLGMRRVRAGAHSSMSKTTSTATGVQSFIFDVDETTDTERKATATIYYRLTLSGISKFEGPRVLGLAFDQIPSNLWELVPLSFVVDMFYDVGAWLSNIAPSGNVQYIGNSVSQKVTCRFRSTPGKVYYCTASNEASGGEPSVYKSETNSLYRVVNMPIPALPVFRGFLSLKNAITITALLWANMPKSWQRR